MGNKGIVVQFSVSNVTISLTGPFIFGTKILSVNDKDFKNLKKA